MPSFKPLPSDLSNKEWTLLGPLMPPPARTGRPRADDRKTVNGILYVLSTGCRLEDLPPERYGSGKTCWYRFTSWRKDGRWAAMAGILLMELNKKRKINWSNAYLDASIRQNKKGVTIRLGTQGYDSVAFRNELRKRGIKPDVDHRDFTNRHQPERTWNDAMRPAAGRWSAPSRASTNNGVLIISGSTHGRSTRAS